VRSGGRSSSLTTASAYDFAEQLLASQRKFAEEVLKTTSPLLPGASSTPSAKATK